MIADLLLRLERQGYAARTVSARRARDLKEEIETRHRDGLLDEDLYVEYLSHFAADPPGDARSLIVMAARQPQVRLTFGWQGHSVPVVVPPTYLHGKVTDQKMADALSGLLGPAGYRVAPAAVPKKLLAARSGLATYGRNNITYVPGMGSFHRLAAFFSDMPCDGDTWQEPKPLDRCAGCRACSTLCPTGAIAPDRFLLHAARCLVYHNEKPSSVPFPAWIDPSWHNCLVGCMLCQRACPEDHDRRDFIEDGARFSGEDTALILAGTGIDGLPVALAQKLKDADLAASLDILPRNLGTLLAQVDAGPRNDSRKNGL